MPIPISYPLVNGHRYSFVSIEFSANGAVMRGVKSIDYGDKLTPGKMRGTGPNVIGRTRGEYDGDASIELYRLEWENLKSTLGAGGVGFGEQSWDITVTYGEQGQPVVTDTLESCRITEARGGGQEGADPSSIKLTIDLLRILWAGVPIYTPTSGG